MAEHWFLKCRILRKVVLVSRHRAGCFYRPKEGCTRYPVIVPAQPWTAMVSLLTTLATMSARLEKSQRRVERQRLLLLAANKLLSKLSTLRTQWALLWIQRVLNQYNAGWGMLILLLSRRCGSEISSQRWNCAQNCTESWETVRRGVTDQSDLKLARNPGVRGCVANPFVACPYQVRISCWIEGNNSYSVASSWVISVELNRSSSQPKLATWVYICGWLVSCCGFYRLGWAITKTTRVRLFFA